MRLATVYERRGRIFVSAFAKTPAPTEGGLARPLLDLAGVKSFSTFARGAKAVHVEQQGD
jgi:hypothetical protein